MMPNLPATVLCQDLALQETIQSSTNFTTHGAVHVICAWPVSAQYGPGVRWLYYLIIANCVFFRKVTWLRSSCLVAALLLPAVAAFHAIVLASVHVNSAIDMNIYGAFQFCALGILTAPFSVKFSRIYFYAQGRQVALLWICLIFAGLLCLIVEFCRINPVPCLQDDNSNPISTSIGDFPYQLTTCGLKCNASYAVSRLRQGSANNVYVIPAPTVLTFGTATILSSACCSLSAFVLISSWYKILKIQWRDIFEGHDTLDLQIEGVNSATSFSKRRAIKKTSRLALLILEVPLLIIASLAMLILGEVNFFSAQVRFQTERMATFGQWAPLVGTALAVVGASYFVLTKDPDNNEVTELSIYHPLRESQFRLIELHSGFGDNDPITGSLQQFDMNEPPRYNALSYAWGQEPEIHRIEINNKGVMLRPNIYQALQRLRARNKDLPTSFPRYLWIDSLCIDQKNLDEKNIQVGQMAEIYRNAKSVFIWLGEEDFVSNSAISFVRRIVAKEFSWHSKWWEAYELTALNQFLGRPWFRRRWVLQEAAFSAHSVVICGGEEIPLDDLADTVSLLRKRLNVASSTMDSSKMNNPPRDIYPAFYDSPATRVFALINNVFKRSNGGDIVDRRLHLETLVDLSTFCETSNQRDTIYALLSLSKEQEILSRSHPAYSLVIDYKMELMDVFAGFLLHCCYHSGSLDVIYRPWAPGSASRLNLNGQTTPTDREFLSNLPSWIASIDRLPFGNPSLGLTQRIHGKHLAGRPPNPLDSTGRLYTSRSAEEHHDSELYAPPRNIVHSITPNQPRDISFAEGSAPQSMIELEEVPFALNHVYNAHYNTKPDVFLGRHSTTQACTGSFFTKGIIIGSIVRRSVRMANAVIPAECFEVLGLSDSPLDQSDVWRILYADRDDEGNKAPPSFRSAFLGTISRPQVAGYAAQPRPNTISVDVEELLQEDGLADDVKRYLAVVRDVVWNRHAFEVERHERIGLPVVGLAPSDATPGDNVCILYGCSVPVVLREHSGNNGVDSYWQLIGDAYVHGFMDGEGIQSLSLDMLEAAEVLFEIR